MNDVSILFTRSHEMVLATALEHNLVAQGRTWEEAERRLILGILVSEARSRQIGHTARKGAKANTKGLWERAWEVTPPRHGESLAVFRHLTDQVASSGGRVFVRIAAEGVTHGDLALQPSSSRIAP